jgi:lysyl-tRNA synthetase class 2
MTDKLTQVRLEKLDRLRKEGLDPYPARVNRTHTSSAAVDAFEAASKDEEVRVAVAGRLRSIREMGRTAFAHIEDGDGRLQLYLREDELGPDQFDLFLEAFDLGDFVQAEGGMFRTRTGEATVRVETFLIVSKAAYPLPAVKEEVIDDEIVIHSAFDNPEARYRERYADLAVNPDVREVFRTRARIIEALRQYLNNLDFLEVETPVLQPIYGGAAAEPFVTHHNQLHQDLYLRISFELYLKRLLVGGIERVYEIGKDFRNEGVDRTHQPEFTQLEFYMAYADYQLVMDVTEDMIAYVVEQVLGGAQFEYQGQTIDVTPPWGRIELQAAIAEQTGIDFGEHNSEKALRKAISKAGIEAPEKASRGKLIEHLLDHHVVPELIQPTFLYGYPRDISPLAKANPDNPDSVERFEGFVAGMEIFNAFTELNDPAEQEQRFLEMGRAYEKDDVNRHPLDEDYLRAMRYGMPPNGGFGMGIDRLTMLLTDRSSIREVILFPHLRTKEN